MTNQLQELHRHYRACWNAVAWCELFVSANDIDDEDLWAELREEYSDIEDVISVFVETVNESGSDMKPSVRAAVLRDMGTKLFRRYVGGKLGMM